MDGLYNLDFGQLQSDPNLYEDHNQKLSEFYRPSYQSIPVSNNPTQQITTPNISGQKPPESNLSAQDYLSRLFSQPQQQNQNELLPNGGYANARNSGGGSGLSSIMSIIKMFTEG